MEVAHADILVVAAIAVLAPVLADLSRKAKVPIVVAEIALGIVVGPQVLDLARTDNFIEALSTFGLAFLFFLAGMEIDFERIKGAPVELGVGGWVMSIGLGAVAAVTLHVTGVIHATVLVALALTTTALGTLMPILRDSGILDQRFGNFVVGAGAAAEFGPVVIVSVILAFDADEALALAPPVRLRGRRRRRERVRGPRPAGPGRAAGRDDDGHQRPARGPPRRCC